MLTMHRRCLYAVTFFVVAAGITGCFWVGKQNDPESLDYVNWVVPDVLSSSDGKLLTSQSSKELLEKFPPKKMNRMFKVISDELGAMTKYDGAKGMTRFLSPSPSGITEIAQYDAKVEFTKGAATVHFGAWKRGGKWEITAFYVEPE